MHAVSNGLHRKAAQASVLQRDDPMIRTLNGGFYCPKDRMQWLFEPKLDGRRATWRFSG
jgi:ATP-dependent DNA ligase